MFGTTGSGKSSALVKPTLLHWCGGAFIIDIGSGLIEDTATQDDIIFNPLSLKTVPFNVLDEVDCLNDDGEKIRALKEMASSIIPVNLKAEEKDSFYPRGAQHILEAVLIAGYFKGLDFCDICSWMSTASDYRALFNEIDELGFGKYLDFVKEEEPKYIGAFLSLCRTKVKIFVEDERVCNAIRRPRGNERDIIPADMEEAKIFVYLKDSDLEYLSPVLSLLTGRILKYISVRSLDINTPILVMLDEFSSLGVLDITPTLRKARKRHCRVMIATQSVADIDLVYGEPMRKAMMDNFELICVLEVHDPDTQQYFSRMVGKRTGIRVSTAEDGFSGRKTYNETDIDAVEPTQLGKLDDSLLVIHRAGYCFLQRNYLHARQTHWLSEARNFYHLYQLNRSNK